MQFSGAPALTAASLNILAASLLHFCADGWNPNIITFLVFAAIIDLNIVVDVGLVTGVTPAIIPTGSAISRYPSSSFSFITPTVFSFLMLWYIYSVANMFFVILSSYIPLPVSSTAIFASSMWCSSPAIDIAFTMLFTCSWSSFKYSSDAFFAFATNSSIIFCIFSSSKFSAIRFPPWYLFYPFLLYIIRKICQPLL